MSLIKCPECYNQVSNKAAACPHCGYPIKNKIKKDIFQLSEKERLKELSKIRQGRELKNSKPESVRRSTIFCSYLLAILMPFFGFFAGLYLLTKKQVGHGVVVMGISSLIVLLIWSFTPAFLLNLNF